MSLSTSSQISYNTSRDADFITSLTRPFQFLTTFSVKTFLLTSNLNLLWPNSRPLPCILPLITWEEKPTTSLVQSQSIHQLQCFLLNKLQHLDVILTARGPKPNTIPEVQSDQCQTQKEDHYSGPADQTIFMAIGLSDHLSTLMAHFQLIVNSHL